MSVAWIKRTHAAFSSLFARGFIVHILKPWKVNCLVHVKICPSRMSFSIGCCTRRCSVGFGKGSRRSWIKSSRKLCGRSFPRSKAPIASAFRPRAATPEFSSVTAHSPCKACRISKWVRLRPVCSGAPPGLKITSLFYSSSSLKWAIEI